MATINTGPTPVNTGTTTTTIGPLDRSPGAVSYGVDPAIPTPTPQYYRPLDVSPGPVTPGVGLGINPGATPAAPIPVFEIPVQEPAPEGAGASVPVATPIYIKVLSDGTIVTENTLALNFLGTGVSIAADGSTANITITAGSGIPGGSNTQIQFNSSGTLGASANLTFNSSTNLLSVGGNVSATGNITGNYIIGNGSQLTGLPASYGNANVAANLAAFGSNPISTTGNITGNYFIGNGSQLTGVTASAAGGNGAVQFSANGVLSGASGFNYNTTANALFVPSINATGNPNTGVDAIYGGVGGYVVLGSSVMAQFTGNVNAYSQINFQNINNGNRSSGDYIITANNGTDSTYYLDLGLAGSNHDDPAFFGDTSTKNDGYLYVNGNSQTGPAGGVGNLIVGSTTGVIKMFVGNTAQANVIATVSQTGVSVAGNITSNNLIISSGIVGSGASPAPSLSGFSTISTTGAAGNISASGNLLAAGYVSATGNITSGNLLTAGIVSAAGNINAARFYGDVGNVTYQQTTTYYVDPLRTANYTPTGTIIKPYGNVTAAIAAAVAAGITDANPAEVILLNNTTENITMAPGVYLTSPGTGTHGSPVITGSVTVTSSTGTLVTNHYSISNLRIVAPSNGHGINFTGSAPQKLFVRDVWIDASGTGDCIYMDNSNATSTLQMDIAHLTHSGSGDIYCINVTAGNCYVTDIETSGATQVAAVQTGALLTINGSELDANGDVVCETYGTGSLTITNSILTNTATNGNGIKINSAGSTVTVGQCLFSIPVGTGSVVYYNPAATLLGSNIAFASISFLPGTNTTIDARLLPIPLAVAVGTIASPILYGDITSYSVAQDWDLIDNNASALSFDTTGKAGVLELVTTNSAEGVKMSGFASVTGNVTGGNLNAAGLSLSGNVVSALVSAANITTTANISGGFILGNGSLLTGIAASSYGNANVVANLAALGTNPVSTTGNITGGNILFGIFNLLGNGDAQVGNLTVSNGPGVGNLVVGNIISATGNILTGGNVSATANVTGGNLTTGGLISATGNITGGNLTVGSGTITGGNVNGAVFNGNVAFGTGTVGGSGNITGGNIAVSGVLLSTNTVSATGNITGGNINTGGNISTTGNVIALDIRVGPGITGGTISALGNITSANTLNAAGLSLSGNVVSALTSAANITTTANISGGNILGTHVGNVTGTTVSVTGNITGGNINTANATIIGATGTISALGNITGGNLLFGTGIVSGTGNITGGNLIGPHANGTSNINIPAASGNVAVGVGGTANVLVVATTGIVANVSTTTTATPANGVGYIGMPVSAVTGTGTLTIADAGKLVYITGASQTVTIPANGSVAFPIGTAITFIAGPASSATSIAITTDTMYLAGTGSTGTRTLAANAMATAVKVASTTWYINGTGLS